MKLKQNDNVVDNIMITSRFKRRVLPCSTASVIGFNLSTVVE